MSIFSFIGAVALLLFSHYFRIRRWEQFISIYERPSQTALIRALSGSYLINFIIPYHIGDIFRAIYAGTRMKNGIGFSLATIIVERFLDILVVAIAFALFYLGGAKYSFVIESAIFYWAAATALVLLFTASILWKDKVKNICHLVCSIFNDSLKLKGMFFFWSLINTFKDLLKINYFELAKNTCLIWGCYLTSYGFLAKYISSRSSSVTIFEVFSTLFSHSNLGAETLKVTERLIGTDQNNIIMIILYIIIPPVLLLIITFLPYYVKQKMASVIIGSSVPTDYLNLLPQINLKERLKFLDQYFDAQNNEYLKKFIEMNRDISILEDYSAGSNATTMLCMNSGQTFYRKYAFGSDGDKLKDQLDWIKSKSTMLPLCEIIHSDYGKGYCCYDMAYDSNAIGMFRYIHSNPLEKSQEILKTVLDTLNHTLYQANTHDDKENIIEEYISKKVLGNLEQIQSAKSLKELTQYEYIIINGKLYRNFPLLSTMFYPEHLKEIFKNDPCSDIHGDLTIENIICRNDRNFISDSYYIIDPNTGNIHDSAYLDYGKLLQSLHGGYEFLMMTPTVTVTDNRVVFASTRSSVYDEMLKFLKDYLNQNFTPEGVRSIFYHEVAHWLRLMPYKIKKDGKRAAMFYAGLIIVCNDVWNWYEEDAI